MILAFKGEILTCENGHPCFVVLKTIHSGTYIHLNSVEPIALNDWPLGAGADLCPHCGKHILSGLLKERIARFRGPHGNALYKAFLAQNDVT
jgi:hypothetical protein